MFFFQSSISSVYSSVISTESEARREHLPADGGGSADPSSGDSMSGGTGPASAEDADGGGSLRMWMVFPLCAAIVLVLVFVAVVVLIRYRLGTPSCTAAAVAVAGLANSKTGVIRRTSRAPFDIIDWTLLEN